jgi:hypothetical protein
MFKKYCIIPVLVIAACITASAQSAAERDSAKQELLAINKLFDSSAYLGFDMQVRYHTDTSAGKFNRYERNGVYYLNNTNFFYREGEMEYMQNNAFAVSIDHAEKIMLVSKKAATPPGAVLLKDFIDNAVDLYATAYTIGLNYVDSNLRRISFELTGNPAVPPAYKRFTLLYDTATNYPESMDIELTKELPLNLPPGSTMVQPAPLRQFITIEFSGFRALPGTQIFDAANYFVYDNITKRYSPAEQYKYYKLVLAGIEEAAAEYSPGYLGEQAQ